MKPTIIRLIKNQVRQLFIQMNWPVTRNLKYDILTKKILDRELTPTSNCIDVGAHKGEILDLFLHYSPQGKHHAFEPIPAMYEHLKEKYAGQASIYPYALSNREGAMLFNVVLDAPAYSGLQRREYKTAQPEIHSIEVEVRILDHVLNGRQHAVDLIKIDVEGGEMDVLKGATSLLAKDKPMLIFEFGKGASEYYGTLPHHMHEWLSQHDYAMWTLEDFWKRKAPLSSDQLKQVYDSGSDYYFVAQSNAR